LKFVWQTLKRRKKKHCWEIDRTCLPNTSLAKNQRYKNYLKTVFGKLTLRKKNAFVPLKNLKLNKHALNLMDSTQPHGLGFPAQNSKAHKKIHV